MSMSFVDIIAVHISVFLTSLLCIFLKIRHYVLFILASPRLGVLVCTEDRCRDTQCGDPKLFIFFQSLCIDKPSFVVCSSPSTSFMLPPAPRILNEGEEEKMNSEKWKHTHTIAES